MYVFNRLFSLPLRTLLLLLSHFKEDPSDLFSQQAQRRPCVSEGGKVTTMIKIKYGESQVMAVNPIFRSESFGHYLPEQSYSMMEKRQLFLRSYQFCRKKSVAERIKGSLVRAKKAVWQKLRSALGLRKLVFSRFKCGFYYRRRRFFRLFNGHHPYSRSDSCFF